MDENEARNPLLGLITNDAKNIEQQIVEELLNHKNLETKTELHRPNLFACLKIIENYLSQHKLQKSSNILSVFTEYTFLYLISKDRKGRLEYIDALKGLREKSEVITPIDMQLKK